MHEQATREIISLRAEGQRLAALTQRLADTAQAQLDEMKIGLDDLAAQLGIIEPSPLPMLPMRERTPTGLQTGLPMSEESVLSIFDQTAASFTPHSDSFNGGEPNRMMS